MFTHSEKSWYVVYTKPRFEKKVLEFLNKVDVESYCPFNEVLRQWSDRKKVVLEPIFKNYVFIRVSRQHMWIINDVPGILNYVYWLGRPALIPDSEIEAVKEFFKTNKKFYLKHTAFKPGDQVKINCGLFANLEGKFIAFRGKKIQVLIPSLGLTLFALNDTGTEIVKIAV